MPMQKNEVISIITTFHKLQPNRISKFVEVALPEASRYARAIKKNEDPDFLVGLFIKWHDKYKRLI